MKLPFSFYSAYFLLPPFQLYLLTLLHQDTTEDDLGHKLALLAIKDANSKISIM